MSYPTFVGNEQNDDELYYDVPSDFFETMQKFMACNSGLTTKEYVEMIDFYKFTEKTLIGFFKLVNTHKNTFHKKCGPFKLQNGRWYSQSDKSQTIDSLREEINRLTKENIALQLSFEKLSKENIELKQSKFVDMKKFQEHIESLDQVGDIKYSRTL